MKTVSGIFLVFVCFRIVQLLSNFSRRLDTFAKTILMAVQSLTFYMCILVIVLLSYSSCCQLFYGDVFYEFSTVWRSTMTVILIILKDQNIIDRMYRRNPNVTSNIYVLIMISLKFILFYIFFSIIYTAYQQVEKTKNEKKPLLDEILDEKHWTNKIKDFFISLKRRCSKSTREASKSEDRAAKAAALEIKKDKSTRLMLKRKSTLNKASVDE
jgi:hypothetical protein